MKRALASFSKESFEEKDPKIKTILFSICYFHSALCERRKYGPKGWNNIYPFTILDLGVSADVMINYMKTNDASEKVPWNALKYLIGEIIYGGHIINDYDRRFTATFLNEFMNDGLLDQAELFPFIEGKGISFKSPAPNLYEKYFEYIET